MCVCVCVCVGVWVRRSVEFCLVTHNRTVVAMILTSFALSLIVGTCGRKSLSTRDERGKSLNEMSYRHRLELVLA